VTTKKKRCLKRVWVSWLSMSAGPVCGTVVTLRETWGVARTCDKETGKKRGGFGVEKGQRKIPCSNLKILGKNGNTLAKKGGGKKSAHPGCSGSWYCNNGGKKKGQ